MSAHGQTCTPFTSMDQKLRSCIHWPEISISKLLTLSDGLSKSERTMVLIFFLVCESKCKIIIENGILKATLQLNPRFRSQSSIIFHLGTFTIVCCSISELFNKQNLMLKCFLRFFIMCSTLTSRANKLKNTNVHAHTHWICFICKPCEKLQKK